MTFSMDESMKRALSSYDYDKLTNDLYEFEKEFHSIKLEPNDTTHKVSHNFNVDSPVQNTTAGYSKEMLNDNKNSIYFLKSWPNFLNPKLLATTLSIKKKIIENGVLVEKIVGFDILINSEHYLFDMEDYNDSYHLSTVIFHELLHALNYQHTEDKDSIMYKSISKHDHFAVHEIDVHNH